MRNLKNFKVSNTGNVIDINLTKTVMTEDGSRKVSQGLSFYDTAEGYAKILTVVKDATKWTLN